MNMEKLIQSYHDTTETELTFNQMAIHKDLKHLKTAVDRALTGEFVAINDMPFLSKELSFRWARIQELNQKRREYSQILEVFSEGGER
jgi:hypothetical protein